MNFFGHAVVASWQRAEPEFALGAMLPDLVQMVGCHRVSSSSPTVAAGITFHYRTDSVFHDSPTFVHLQRQAWAELAQFPIRRGARLAVAHVGLELILDSKLAQSEAHVRHYTRALQVLLESNLSASLRFDADFDGRDGLENLARTLLARRAYLAPQNPEQLFDRLQRILRHRPTLALTSADASPVIDWSRAAFVRVGKYLPTWLNELRGGLGLPLGRTPANVQPSASEAS